VRVPATGDWTFVIGPEFDLLDNGDSVQAIHGKRVVYVSSSRVGTADTPARLAQIRAPAARSLGAGERFSHVAESVEGDAAIQQGTDAWRLHGIMCADGTYAICTIDYQSPGDRAWAVDVWRSLQPAGVAA
jgi:hypothetical protein